MDGTIDTAAQAIAAARESQEPAQAAPQTAEVVDIQERRQPDRGTDGKFQKAEPDSSPGTDVEPAADAESDEDYLELEFADEEGKEPKRERLKVAEVYDGYRRAKDLEAEVKKLKTSQPLPQHYEQALEATVAERMQYADALQRWAQFNQPRAPSRDLINPASPNYNPELYYQQMQAHDETVANNERVAAELERVQKLNEQQSNQLHQSRLVREAQALKAVWPELSDKATFQKVAADLEKHFGLDAVTIKSVSDHRFYALAKDALAYRAAQAAKKEAVKAVVAKPKLVRANARQNIDSKAAVRDSAFGKLAKSGSLEDAAAAIATIR